MISRGDNIKGYIVEDELGHGGFGVVYLVHDEKDENRKYAIKLIKADYTDPILVFPGTFFAFSPECEKMTVPD